MAGTAIEAYLEVGGKRTFAGAIAWPGWCRSGRDEAAALQALVDHAPRYVAALATTGLAPVVPSGVGRLAVIGRVTGGPTTDFGAPGAFAPGDEMLLDETELARQMTILRACWTTLDGAAARVAGRELMRGPRGGGRSAAAILGHVSDAEGGYLGRLGVRAPAGLTARREAVIAALTAVAPLGTPPPGPRGGSRWPARYFVRRVAWHALDHAWEIEDRTPPT